MFFYGDKSNKELSERVGKKLNAKIDFPEVTIFPDGERSVRVSSGVSGKNVIILKSFFPQVDSSILEFAFTIDALKHTGAKKITGITPYLPYAQADHVSFPGGGLSLEIVIRMFENAGLDEILFIDPHTEKVEKLFRIPVIVRSAILLFAEKIKLLNIEFDQIVLVSPDKGALVSVKKLSELLGNMSYIALSKKRIDGKKVEVQEIKGEVKETCIIVDDMILSGETIIKTIEALREKGAKNIYVFATHGIFSGDSLQMLKNSQIKKIFVTDSIPVDKAERFGKLEILSTADLISKELI